MRERVLDIEILRECFACDAERGHLIWKRRPVRHFKTEKSQKIWNTTHAGAKAGTVGTDGFNRTSVSIDGDRFCLLVHRAMWALTRGRWPDHDIVPANGILSDDRPGNLREVTRKRVMQTRREMKKNKLGLKGVSRSRDKFEARIMRDGSRVHLGTYSAPEIAGQAYLAASQVYERSLASDISGEDQCLA